MFFFITHDLKKCRLKKTQLMPSISMKQTKKDSRNTLGARTRDIGEEALVAVVGQEVDVQIRWQGGEGREALLPAGVAGRRREMRGESDMVTSARGELLDLL